MVQFRVILVGLNKMITKSTMKFLKLYRWGPHVLPGAARTLPDYCQHSRKSISQSIVCQKQNLKRPDVLKLQNELLEEERKKFEDTFGDIEKFEVTFQRIKEDPEDVKEYDRNRAAQGKTIRNYQDEIKFHLQKNDYKSAIRILEVDMMNDRKPPVSHIYDVMVAYNAKIGDLKEAYRLYIQYKKRGGLVSGGMYTSMFEACANCKNAFFAIEKANSIRESLEKDKRHKVNITNYNAMIKAFARHGDMATCLKIFDEVIERRDKVKSITYCFLFQACISDKNSGLRYALLLWRKMLQNKVKPTIFSFNLMLRCVRECSLGETQLINNLVQEIINESQHFYQKKVVMNTISGKTIRKIHKIPTDSRGLITEDEKSPTEEAFHNQSLTKNTIENVEPTQPMLNEEKSSSEFGELEVLEDVPQPNLSSENQQTPNLLALQPSVGNVISFGAMKLPHERFMCLGGLKGFLKVMRQFNVKPDIKTFTLLLNVIPSTIEAEEELISEIKKNGTKLDSGFFNVLIKRRNSRDDNATVQNVLKMMQDEEVKPDIITFGVLALGCETFEKGVHLMEAARSFGFRLNEQILGALLVNASNARDMKFVKTILDAAKQDEAKLGPKFMAQLSKAVQKEKKLRYQSLYYVENEKKDIEKSSQTA